MGQQQPILGYALRAQLPLVTVTTADNLHALGMIQFWAPKQQVESVENLSIEHLGYARRKRVLVTSEIVSPAEDVYTEAAEWNITVLWLNPEPEDDTGLAFDAGDIPVPMEMVRDLLAEVLTEKQVQRCLPLMHGLTIKEAREVLSLAWAVGKTVKPDSIVAARRMTGSSIRGVEAIDTACPHYWPRADLRKWVDFEAPFLVGDVDPLYRPRGVLLWGAPGTGKTLGAKYIAKRVGVPLFRLDLGHLMSKWQGESESNLRRALSKVENESPCVMLLDEVEKVFKAGADADVTHRLLGYLLWWLQEHQSPIVTVMTTNDLDALPPELYRRGRIDRLYKFQAMKTADAKKFARHLYKFHSKNWPHAPDWETLTTGLALDDGATHAEVDNAMIGEFKKANQPAIEGNSNE